MKNALVEERIPRVESQISLGIMLYTVRDLLERDFVGTIRKIASYGFKIVELIGLTSHPLVEDPMFGLELQELRHILNDHGLRAVSSHTDPTQDMASQLEVAQALDVEYLVVPIAPEFILMTAEGPRLREDLDPADCMTVADRLNLVGEQCQRRGMTVAYHNHHAEFLGKSEKTAYDIILENTDPSLVTMELDTGWVVKAGLDPKEIVNKYPGRFSLCHIKDIDPSRTNTGMGEEFVAPGDGVLELSEIIDAANDAGVRYGFVECEFPEDSGDLLKKAAALVTN